MNLRKGETMKKTKEECMAWQPKSDHTALEKCEAFDLLRGMALEWLKTVKEEQCDDVLSDFRVYITEAVLKLTLGKDVFDYTNPLR